ncbi:Acg family FMN-binding oxidoreductase [Nocardia farcinica]|uniref:Acg family FMN-binding oxidoreductase n=1 Tax=Nocardia farcinica TaxID=37329 RepID=UPI0015F03DA0|nr:NAD(P)H nitroreductase [Nocardia farcinica]MBA4854324.1 NAD(P)H nitroreductase [Nocardia farcinica]MBC9814509.1 NAD(P)H nitroreductase [Nocardia farcinica]
MHRGLPDDSTVATALALAGRAPSVHNVQPWRWRIDRHSVHLYLDPARTLPRTDPDRRDVVISCGAALHHLTVAFTAMGWASVVTRLPDPADPDHLAAIRLVAHRATGQDIAMSAMIPKRRTDRRHYAPLPLPPGCFGLLAERAAALGAMVRVVDDGARARLVEAARAAARVHAEDEDYRFELALWSGRHGSDDGVPARNAPPPRESDVLPARVFSAPTLVDPARAGDHAELLVIATPADDRLARLRVGEALSAVLLTATNIGLATCPLTEPLGIRDHRAMIRRGVLNGTAHPQVVLRIGWAPEGAEALPRTPRRAVSEMLVPGDG